MGAEKNDGKFTVEDFCTADLPAQTPRKIPESDRWVSDWLTVDCQWCSMQRICKLTLWKVFRPCICSIYVQYKHGCTGTDGTPFSGKEPLPPLTLATFFVCLCLNSSVLQKHCQPTRSSAFLAPDRFVLLASGLGLGGTGADSMLGLQLLVDMVTGHLGDEGEQSGAASISRVLLAGNLLSQTTQDKDSSTKVRLVE